MTDTLEAPAIDVEQVEPDETETPIGATDTEEAPEAAEADETAVAAEVDQAAEAVDTTETDVTVESDDAAESDDEVIVAGVKGSRRKLRVLLLALLATFAVALVAFAGWYVVVRKPISEFPLPLPNTQQMPGYGYSFYGALRPTGIAVTADGSRIYATQTTGDTAVIAFDAQGNSVAHLTPPETGSDHVFVYVAVNPLNGDVYVSDRPAASIYIYGADGSYKGTFDPPSSLTGWQPLGISFDATGNLLVTDPSLNVIHEFAPDGSLLRSIGQPGEFSFPNSAVADSSGRLYVADSNNGRLVVLASDGTQIGTVRRGPADGDVGLPRGMAIDDHQRVYVVDSIDQAVKVYQVGADPTSPLTFIGRFGDPGSSDGAFNFPNAVATDARGRVYVADWNNDRVQIWTY